MEINKITIGAPGTLQGNFTPQVRVYHGEGCDIFNLPFLGKARDRKTAMQRGREWLLRPGSVEAAATALRLLYAGSSSGINVYELINRVLRSTA